MTHLISIVFECDDRRGEFIEVTGVYRVIPGPVQGKTTGLFPVIIWATTIEPLVHTVDISRDEVPIIHTLSRRPDLFQLLAKSVAPQISGHNRIKEGILAMMIGGDTSVEAEGERSNIHILIMGDPGCAKSQLMRFVHNTMPNGTRLHFCEFFIECYFYWLT